MTYATLCAFVRSYLLSSSALFVSWCPLTVSPVSVDCQSGGYAKMVLSKSKIDPRNKWVQQNHLMDDPRTNVKATLMKLTPQGWQPGRPLCILGICNWLDLSVESFFRLNGVKMVIKASGDQPDLPLKPPSYGIPKAEFIFRSLPANNRDMVKDGWESLVHAIIAVWQSGSLEKPAVVMVHCNEGINRAVILALLIASKIHGSNPFLEASVLRQHRPINPMWVSMEAKDKYDVKSLETMTRSRKWVAEHGFFLVERDTSRYKLLWSYFGDAKYYRGSDAADSSDRRQAASSIPKEPQRGRPIMRRARSEDSRADSHGRDGYDGGSRRQSARGKEQRPWLENRPAMRRAPRESSSSSYEWYSCSGSDSDSSVAPEPARVRDGGVFKDIRTALAASPRRCDARPVHVDRAASPDAPKLKARLSPNMEWVRIGQNWKRQSELASTDRNVDRNSPSPSSRTRATPERGDAEGAYSPTHSGAMTAWLKRHHGGKFHYNLHGRHVLHQMIEMFRSRDEVFNMELFCEAVRLTNYWFEGLELRTKRGGRPSLTTAFSMLCCQSFKAQGCQPRDYIECMWFMLERGANQNAKDARGNTGLHLAVGSQNQAPIQFFIDQAASQGKYQFEWESRNNQNWTVLNMAQGKHSYGKCKPILNMMLYMHRRGFISHNQPESLASDARKRKRATTASSDKRKERDAKRRRRP